MSLQCPQCQSEQVVARNYARKTGGAIGTVAGGIGGYSAALSGARLGSAAAGIVLGPGGTVIGGLAGAIIGGLAGALAGGTAGIALGEVIDNKILDNYQCLSCLFIFSLPEDPSDSPFEL
jgi:hypothetical protein